MPIYEYHCESCGHEFEVMQKINDNPIKKCEKCGKQKARRSISKTSFVLKGSGWYVTDYGGKNASQRAPAASASDDKSGDKVAATTASSDTGSTKKAANA